MSDQADALLIVPVQVEAELVRLVPRPASHCQRISTFRLNLSLGLSRFVCIGLTSAAAHRAAPHSPSHPNSRFEPLKRETLDKR